MKSKSDQPLLLSLTLTLALLVTALVLPAYAGESRLLQFPDSPEWVVAGSFQDEISSCGEWSNDCDETGMADDDGDGVYKFVADAIPAGSFEYKVVEYGNWDNAHPPSNVFLPAPGDRISFYFNPMTSAVADSVNQCIATVAGDFQSEIGGGDWSPDNLRTMLWQAAPGSDLYRYSATIPAGNWAFKVARDEGWDASYPEDNVSFSIAQATQVNFEYNCATNAVSFSFGGGADHDDNIFWNDLGHNSRDPQYRTPQGPVNTGTPVTVRLRAASGDLTGARVRVWDDYRDAQLMLEMSLVADDGAYEWWEATIPASSEPTIYWYRFIAIDGTATAYYEDNADRDMGWGQTFGDSPDYSYQLTVYDPAFYTPDWVKDAIIYQIFTDRFRDGDPGNNPAPGRFFYGELDGTIFRSHDSVTAGDPWQELAWNTVVCDPRDPADCPGTYSLNFYGGDLQGVLDKLDYLESIGVTALYFNPIFESPSNHKYDTTDFTRIAVDFGDEELFRTLVSAAHARGMYVILDGVFNHTSSDSIYFDRYGRYDTLGACESVASPHRDWFYFTDVTPGSGACAGSDGTPAAANYESWFGFASLPKLNSANTAVRDYFWDGADGGIGTYWLAPPQSGEGDGADGWRLDVGGDVDPGRTNAPANDYWEGFRTAVRATNPEAYIVIEEWGNASPWLLGEEMDATMNYQYSTAMLGFWRDTPFTDNDHNEGSSAGPIVPLSPSALDNRLHNWIERYPPQALYAMMNLLGSHDTNRPLFFLDHNAAELEAGGVPLLLDPGYDWSEQIERLKGVWILQMTLPGAPTTYYGDEVGLVGPTYYSGGRWEDDPYNRQPYPWLDEEESETPLGLPFYTFLQSESNQTALRDYYSTLTAARHSHAALRTGSFDTLLVDDANDVYAYGRLLADYSDAAVVILNRAGTIAGPVPQIVTLDVAGYLPAGASFTDVLSGDSYTVDAGGQLVVSVPGQSGALLVLDAAMPVPPTAVTDLTVESTGDGEVALAWNPSSGADSYRVFRSLVSGGGYTLVAETGSTGYLDDGLANATAYYYVVVAVDSATGLTSGWSNEVTAIPQYDLSEAWYNLQWPYDIFHTISTVNRTETIYGQIYIPGVTAPSGPAPAIRAQVGFGPDGSQPGEPGWTWEEMVFNVDVGNNDEYMGSLLPDHLGNFIYVTRWSVDGGRTWHYSDLGGPTGLPATNPGRLYVEPGDDQTPPPAPANLVLDGTTPSSILMSWDVVDAEDLAGYEVYREQLAPPATGFTRVARLDSDAGSYADYGVETGATYRYFVLAFDTSFNRSAPSNEIEATAESRFVSVTFRVRVPDYTPGTVYLVGDIAALGPWNPGLVPMTQVESDIWEHTLEILDGTHLQYKYTRGSWDTVESWGSIVNINNRHVIIEYGIGGTMLVDNTGTNWEDDDDHVDAVRYWRDPLVVDVYPEPGATEVPIRGTTIRVTWSVPMAPGTGFEVINPQGRAVAGTFGYDDATMTTIFTPAHPLAPVGTYSVTVRDQISVGVPGGDSGLQQAPFIWAFSTHPAQVSRSGQDG
jgi:glycosidase